MLLGAEALEDCASPRGIELRVVASTLMKKASSVARGNEGCVMVGWNKVGRRPSAKSPKKHVAPRRGP